MSNKPIACLISARLQFSLYKSFNSGCSGGLSEISVDSQSRSPILRSVELVSCPAEGPEGSTSSSTSYALPDYPLEMFGGQAVWRNSGELMVCGGANWVRTYSQCYSWSGRSVNGIQYLSISVNTSRLNISARGNGRSQWTEIGRLNYPRAFGFLAYLPEPMCQENKLFILGGMNSITLEPVLTTEVSPH